MNVLIVHPYHSVTWITVKQHSIISPLLDCIFLMMEPVKYAAVCSCVTAHRSPCTAELLSEMNSFTSQGFTVRSCLLPQNEQNIVNLSYKTIKCFYYTANVIPEVTGPKHGALGRLSYSKSAWSATLSGRTDPHSSELQRPALSRCATRHMLESNLEQCHWYYDSVIDADISSGCAAYRSHKCAHGYSGESQASYEQCQALAGMFSYFTVQVPNFFFRVAHVHMVEKGKHRLSLVITWVVRQTYFVWPSVSSCLKHPVKIPVSVVGVATIIVNVSAIIKVISTNDTPVALT